MSYLITCFIVAVIGLIIAVLLLWMKVSHALFLVQQIDDRHIEWAKEIDRQGDNWMSMMLEEVRRNNTRLDRHDNRISSLEHSRRECGKRSD